LSIEGKKFNRLTVIDVDLGMTKKKKRLYVVAKCDCGVVKSYGASHLKNSGIKSCGCFCKEKLKEQNYKKRSKVGDKDNRLTVIEVITEDGKNTRVRCKCNCGNEIITLDSSFKNGYTKSCGCLNIEKIKERHKQTTESLVKVGQFFGNHKVLRQLEEKSKRGDIQWEVINLNTKIITIKTTNQLKSWQTQRIRDVVRNTFNRHSEIKEKHTLLLLNCKDKEIKEFIAKKPIGDYHIDHICPCAQAAGLLELEKLQDIRNLQWLSKEENLTKSAKKTPEGVMMCKLLLDRDWID
jgi:hypothetical protein